MGAPSTETAGIRQAIRALKADGWELVSVGEISNAPLFYQLICGDEPDGVLVTTEKEAIEAIEATGDEWLKVRRYSKGFSGEYDEGAVRFVLGNAPDEVICDYTSNLECITRLTDTWY